MRLAPVVLAYSQAPEKAFEYAALSSKTTHASVISVDACRLMTALMLGALNAVGKAELLANEFGVSAGYWKKWRELCAEIIVVAKGSYQLMAPPDINGTGYAAKSLEAALWAFYRSNSFEEGCLMAANLGDDADTTAAIYGQSAGAFYGIKGIPERWLEQVAMRDVLEKLAHDLCAFSERQKVNV